MKSRITIIDTTLRDGEQMQGVSYDPKDKLAIARAAIDAGVDREEIASANVSRGEFEAARYVVKKFKDMSYPVNKLECLVLLSKDSVDWANDAGLETVNVLSKGSKRQLSQLNMTPDEHEQSVLKVLDYAEDSGMKTNLYLEHFSSGIKENPAYIDSLVKNVKGKAGRIMLCDTLGIDSPATAKRNAKSMARKYPELFFDYHGHNDHGLATANALAAVEGGCSGVHTTVNGMGERAGNAPLHEVVVGLHDIAKKETGVDEKKLYPLSKLVSRLSQVEIPRNMPIVGKNAFMHDCGVHADGMAKKGLYASELGPERFGREYGYALDKHSGKATIEMHLKSMGVDPDKRLVSQILEKVKDISDRKENVTEDDLPFILDDVIGEPEKKMFDIYFNMTVTGKGVTAEGVLNLNYDGNDLSEYGEGNGGFDAMMNALKKALEPFNLGEMPKLVDYSSSIPKGGSTNALVKTLITWKDNSGVILKTTGVDPDQTNSALKATERMLNRYYAKNGL
ncbi:MAG: alpha-isopropylmalate synthase regulatory domain-containing protein [Candidatus Aenigmatarchaeota archaeon]